MTEEQYIPEESVNHDKKYISIMFFVFLLIAIPVYILLLQTGLKIKKSNNSLSQQTAQVTAPTPVAKTFSLPQPTVTPVIISHKQDIDNAIKLLDSTNTVSIEQTLSQTTADASTF